MTANQITKKLNKILTADEMQKVVTYRDGAAVWPVGDDDLDDVIEIARKAAKAIGFGIVSSGFKFMLVPDTQEHFDALDRAMTY